MLSTSEEEFRQRCKIKAMDIAIQLKPLQPVWGTMGSIGGMPNYDIAKKAQEVYDWLILPLE